MSLRPAARPLLLEGHVNEVAMKSRYLNDDFRECLLRMQLMLGKVSGTRKQEKLPEGSVIQKLVVISSASPSKEDTNPLIGQLKARGYATDRVINTETESIYYAVTNAAVVIAWLSAEYLRSHNRRTTLQYAIDCGVPIIYVCDDSSWKPSGLAIDFLISLMPLRLGCAYDRRKPAHQLEGWNALVRRSR
jgi:hypothetical protein